jgi:preprotein translocase subunit SecA
MLDFISRLFGDRNEKEAKKLRPTVDEINRYAEQYQNLSDDELKGKTAEFKARIADATAHIEERRAEIREELKGHRHQDPSGNGQPAPAEELTIDDRHRLNDEYDDLEEEWRDVVESVLDEILPEAFAVVKETARRMIGKEWTAGGTTIKWDMVPYDVQLIGGIVLHQGRIAEMKTGEGKTLVAVAPVYLNALAGRGVHLVTVNPYLAQRDAEWMGPIFEFHGLTVDVIDRYEPHTEGRRRAYNADITYGTNNEFGFDYLRDNSFVVDSDQLVQRHHHFAIVDEVDSVLVDEARTPLIISGPVPQSNDDRFAELKSSIEKVVSAQQRLVAGFVSDAERLLKERDDALAEGDKRRANDLETDAGLALLRAQRGFPRNNKLQKLLQEPGVGQLLRQTEYFYLQDNAKNMPFVDEALHFALDEKQHAIEMTDSGREFAARAAGEDVDLFVLPDLGEEIAKFEGEAEQRLRDVKTELNDDASLSDEKRDHKIENEEHVVKNRLEEKKRELYTLYSERAERLHAIEQLLRAYTLYEKDTEYIVQEGRVQIVDQHTGRVLSGRRYSDGLHQAIEAKENVKVQAATQTYATITLQNYFRMYHKLAGMTGTAETEAEEFHKIYGMDVLVIPTNRPIARGDLDDLVFKTKREKYNAVLTKIEEYHKKGQPVLVGTTSVEVSETLSRMLTRTGIRHNVLNAKRDRAKQESLIVAEAGQKGAVTIATNMAGRGTDIKLGSGVREAGGLAILGTERHESRRIDLQLRGRSGRQGDPGESQFYVSLEDELMRLFGSDRVSKVMDRLNLEEGAVITHPWVNKSIERAQKKVEQNNFAIRKRQLEYDDVLNAQRQVIYDRRRHALVGDRFRGEVLDMLRDVAKEIVDRHYGEGDLEEMREEILRTLAFDFEMDRETFVRLGEDGVTDRVFEGAVEYYNRKRNALARPFKEGMQRLMDSDREDKPERVYVDFSDGRKMMRAVVRVEDAVDSEGQAVNDAIERSAMLSIIDEKWTEHLRELDNVKEGIGLRAYGQRDPLVEYKMEAFKLFAEMMGEINNDVVSFVFRAGPLVDAPARGGAGGQQQRRRLDPNRAQAQHDSMEPTYGVNAGRQGSAERDPTAKKQPVVVEETVGRNDPCPCGSGKKYKHCHGRA